MRAAIAGLEPRIAFEASALAMAVQLVPWQATFARLAPTRPIAGDVRPPLMTWRSTLPGIPVRSVPRSVVTAELSTTGAFRCDLAV
jgi:hypothetical protein